VVGKLAQLSRFIDIIGLSKAAVIQALGSDFGDFEDALQHYCSVGRWRESDRYREYQRLQAKPIGGVDTGSVFEEQGVTIGISQ